MLTLADTWVWDFWVADDGDQFHLFFLQAPTSIEDPELRHTHVSVGHATSADLRAWSVVGTALAPGSAGDDDATATWTGSVIAAPTGGWVMLYTGGRRTRHGIAQTLLQAGSADLATWRKEPRATARPDPSSYETFQDGTPCSHDFRDPWVLRDPGGNGWHALLTARSPDGPDQERGVIGHAWSSDLTAWETRPPLSAPGQGFPFLEVPQVVSVGGRWWLVFSCPADEVARSRRPLPGAGGIWVAPAAGPLGPYDLARAHQLVDDDLYSGRIVVDRSGTPMLLGFHRDPAHERFLCIDDPVPVEVEAGSLRVLPIEASHPSAARVDSTSSKRASISVVSKAVGNSRS